MKNRIEASVVYNGPWWHFLACLLAQGYPVLSFEVGLWTLVPIFNAMYVFGLSIVKGAMYDSTR